MVGAAEDVHIFDVGVAALCPGDHVVDFGVDGGLFATVVDAHTFGGHERDALLYGGGALGATQVQGPAGVGVVDDEEIKFRGTQGEDVHRCEFAVGVGGEAAGGRQVFDILYGHADGERADTFTAFGLYFVMAQQHLVEGIHTALLQATGIVFCFDGAGVTGVAGGCECGFQQG